MADITKDTVTVVFPNGELTGRGTAQQRIFPALFSGQQVVIVRVDSLVLTNDITGDSVQLVPGVDYTTGDNEFITTVAPNWNYSLYWTGEGYYVIDPAVPPVVSMDLLAPVTWRFDQAPRLMSLLTSKNNWYNNNHVQFWNTWIQTVFNLKTAGTFGMAVWAYILNLPLASLSLQDKYRYWAFGALRSNFTDGDIEGQPDNPGSGNFPPAGADGAITTPIEKIAALRLKYYTHITDCSVWGINNLLYDVFHENFGNAYVIDNQDMTMTYVFEFEISTLFQNAMVQYGLLPKPGGVSYTIQVAPPTED